MPQRSISSSRSRVGRGELRFGRRARGDDGAEDAAAFGGDLGVARAGQAPAQLLAPIAGKHDVRMRIHEAGDDGAAVGVDDDGIGRQLDLALQQALEADEDDAALEGGNGRARDRTRVGLGRAAARRRTGTRQDFEGVADEEVGEHGVYCRATDARLKPSRYEGIVRRAPPHSCSAKASERVALSARLSAERRANSLGGDAGNRDPLSPAALAAHDLDGALGDVQGVSEVGDQGVVGGAFDGRRGHANHQRVVAGAGAFGFSGAGNDADVDFDARAGLTNQGRPSTLRGLRVAPSTVEGDSSGQALSAARRVKLGVVEQLLDGEPRPVQQDLVLPLARFLLADELEGVLERRDRRLNRRLGVPALELEAVDFALDVLEPRLRLFQQQIRAPFGLPDDPSGFALRRWP